MALDDRTRWNQRYRNMAADRSPDEVLPPGVPAADGGAPRPLLRIAEPWLARTGRALDLACGAGRETVWLAGRGLDVLGVDIAEEGLALAAALAERQGVAPRVRLVAADLDHGLPPGCEGPFDVIVACHFRSTILEEVVGSELRSKGVVVASRLSVVGRSDAGADGGPDPAFLAEPRELAALARRLDLVIHHHEEADGVAALVAQRL